MSAKLPWDEQWIEDHLYDFTNFKELVDAYNANFGTSYNRFQMRHQAVNNMGLSYKRAYTEEQKAFVMEYYPKLSNKELVKLYNERFDSPRTFAALRSYANKKLGIVKPHDVCCNSHRQPNRKLSKPIGSICVNRNYTSVKCEDGKWRMFSHVKYKEHHGDYPPKGYRIVYLDGNPTNYSKDNMVAVPRNVITFMNTHMNVRRDNPDLTKVALTWSRLYIANRDSHA